MVSDKDIATSDGIEGRHRTGLVINKTRTGNEPLKGRAQEMGLSFLGMIPLDENVADFDYHGRPTIDLPDDSPSLVAVRGILELLNANQVETP